MIVFSSFGIWFNMKSDNKLTMDNLLVGDFKIMLVFFNIYCFVNYSKFYLKNEHNIIHKQ